MDPRVSLHHSCIMLGIVCYLFYSILSSLTVSASSLFIWHTKTTAQAYSQWKRHETDQRLTRGTGGREKKRSRKRSKIPASSHVLGRRDGQFPGCFVQDVNFINLVAEIPGNENPQLVLTFSHSLYILVAQTPF